MRVRNAAQAKEQKRAKLPKSPEDSAPRSNCFCESAHFDLMIKSPRRAALALSEGVEQRAYQVPKSLPGAGFVTRVDFSDQEDSFPFVQELPDYFGELGA